MKGDEKECLLVCRVGGQNAGERFSISLVVADSVAQGEYARAERSLAVAAATLSAGCPLPPGVRPYDTHTTIVTTSCPTQHQAETLHSTRPT